MAKDKTWLYVIGAVALGYFLAPQEVKDKITGAGQGITSFDLSNLLSGLQFPGVSLGGFNLGGEGLGNINDILNQIKEGIPAIPKITIPEITTPSVGGADDLINKMKEWLQPIIPTKPVTQPTGQETPSFWQWFTGLNPVVQNVAAGVGTLGLGYASYKGIQATAPALKTGATAVGNLFSKYLGRVSFAPKVVSATPKLISTGAKAGGLSGGLLLAGAGMIFEIADVAATLIGRSIFPPEWGIHGLSYTLNEAVKSFSGGKAQAAELPAVPSTVKTTDIWALGTKYYQAKPTLQPSTVKAPTYIIPPEKVVLASEAMKLYTGKYGW